MSNKAFEDFTPGDVVEFHHVTVTEDDIIDFATDWDPQPMHLDEEAGKASILGGLTGSGWHMVCLLMRGMCDGFLLGSTSAGSPGVNEIRWLKPLRPGDELTMRYEVMSARTSKSRPGIGIVHFKFETINQNGETIMTMDNPIMFRRRETAEAGS
ncbi:MaoC family dehydratase [Microbaculum marinum]|uniref:MaoC family dehydratase n=1 Tax=Microbaculum marinum TaxID=1764581 RepID=A0AAW9RR05_9HYPH